MICDGGGIFILYNVMEMKNIIVWILSSVLLVWCLFALTPKEEKGVKVLTSPSLVYEQPDRATPFSLDTAPDTIEYWKSILPHPEDRNADLYSVMPTLWIVAPVIFVPEWSDDYHAMVQGQQIEINNYLGSGVLHYPMTWIPGEEWNPVIFGHSNFFKKWSGNYKTIYADIMNLDVDPHDEMRFFLKQNNWKYDLRKFSIEESYETVPTDVWVMKPRWGKEVTVFACTNGLEWRWIVKWKYIEKDEMRVPYPMKWRMIELMGKLSLKDEVQKKEIVEKMLNKISLVRIKWVKNNLTYHDKFKKYLLDRIEKKLVEHY